MACLICTSDLGLKQEDFTVRMSPQFLIWSNSAQCLFPYFKSSSLIAKMSHKETESIFGQFSSIINFCDRLSFCLHSFGFSLPRLCNRTWHFKKDLLWRNNHFSENRPNLLLVLTFVLQTGWFEIYANHVARFLGREKIFLRLFQTNPNQTIHVHAAQMQQYFKCGKRLIFAFGFLAYDYSQIARPFCKVWPGPRTWI